MISEQQKKDTLLDFELARSFCLGATGIECFHERTLKIIRSLLAPARGVIEMEEEWARLIFDDKTIDFILERYPNGLKIVEEKNG